MTLNLRKPKIYCDGSFQSNAAVFALFETTLPIKVFKTQHFEITEQRMVITSSDPATRTVYEINGIPAAQAYAESLGLTIQQLIPQNYSEHPVMLTIGDETFVRSIRHVNADGSLVFYAAIEDGVVLNLGKCGDIVADLRSQLDALASQLPSIQLILGCDCILRRLEIVDKKLQPSVNEILARYNFMGFSTYGEQYNAVHVNQTLTGIAIGG